MYEAGEEYPSIPSRQWSARGLILLPRLMSKASCSDCLFRRIGTFSRLLERSRLARSRPPAVQFVHNPKGFQELCEVDAAVFVEVHTARQVVHGAVVGGDAKARQVRPQGPPGQVQPQHPLQDLGPLTDRHGAWGGTREACEKLRTPSCLHSWERMSSWYPWSISSLRVTSGP
ncbi:hypothetical protein CRUP_016784 [Coryphaenoides rupestris]|nr:hypothetical protein CRUP_016784 [Coryphaenoides rupestris]